MVKKENHSLFVLKLPDDGDSFFNQVAFSKASEILETYDVVGTRRDNFANGVQRIV